MAYKDGKIVAYGAEAEDYITDDEHEVARWFKVKRYLIPPFSF